MREPTGAVSGRACERKRGAYRHRGWVRAPPSVCLCITFRQLMPRLWRETVSASAVAVAVAAATELRVPSAAVSALLLRLPLPPSSSPFPTTPLSRRHPCPLPLSLSLSLPHATTLHSILLVPSSSSSSSCCCLHTSLLFSGRCCCASSSCLCSTLISALPHTLQPPDLVHPTLSAVRAPDCLSASARFVSSTSRRRPHASPSAIAAAVARFTLCPIVAGRLPFPHVETRQYRQDGLWNEYRGQAGAHPP